MPDAPFPADRELTWTRTLAFPPEAVFRAWTEPAWLVQWFCPLPWKAVHADLDVRAGGRSFIVMHGPAGEVVESPGVYLEVVPGRRLVFTDAFTRAWEPGEGTPFMVGILDFHAEGEGTRLEATVRHWSAEKSAEHAAMGFPAGWAVAHDQMEAMLAREWRRA